MRSWPGVTIGFRSFLLALLTLFFVVIIAWFNRPGSDLQLYKQTGLPFGCIPSPQGGYAVQDFAYNLMYLRGIEDHVVPHPYRQTDQAILIHHALPMAGSGMCHAYSPVAFVLGAPLLALPPPIAYIAFSLLATTGFLLLYGLDLLPRVTDRLQLYLLIVCGANITVVTAFAVGQTALITTPMIGAIWYLLRRDTRSSWTVMALALLTWATCMKPSIAIIPLVLLAGARAWSALGLTALFLAMTWAALSPLYGGWRDGLHDYANLVEHYYEDGMIPFMRDVFTRHGDTGANAYFSTLFPGHSELFFTVSRTLFLATTGLLLALRWAGRLTPSQHFRGMIWTFLMLSPYLLPSEDCIVCLLIVEGVFFRSRNIWRDSALLLLMLAIMNLRAGLTFPGQINFPLKCVLLAWMAIEAALRPAMAFPSRR